jgi:hypothetical protein
LIDCPLVHFAHAQQAGDKRNWVGYEQFAMTLRNADASAAMQYLIWALEEIEKEGCPKAANHARLAIEALRDVAAPTGDKTDEHAGSADY